MKAYRAFLVVMLLVVLGILVYSQKSERIDYTKNTQITDTDAQSLSAVSSEGDTERMVSPSGEPVGIYVKTKGVLVIAVNTVESRDGTVHSPCGDALMPGDYIMRINDKAVNDKQTMIDMIENSEGREMLFRVCRDNHYFNVRVTPIEAKSGKYAIGVWVKDDISGIGTITYIEDGQFAALGHSINDNDTGITFRVSDGALYETTIVRIRKPEVQTPGRLEGVINYAGTHIIGRVEDNNAYGIHGYLTKRQQELRMDAPKVPVGTKEEVHTGKAYLLSALSGEARQYEIEIISVDSDNENGKCMEIRVTDASLIELTGGIVQGVSGTPILQDGKLIGAVTHVFVDDPTRGYGIFVEQMMQ